MLRFEIIHIALFPRLHYTEGASRVTLFGENGPLSKPSKSEFWEGDTEHRSGAYLDVREHSSTGSTYPK
ncbi:MAG: palindromic element RPE1 domain-containing protein, partial [Holosporales bacterium]|nr:palindromic element RPE1 domain-containing protein [Holosporales bacterium]